MDNAPALRLPWGMFPLKSLSSSLSFPSLLLILLFFYAGSELQAFAEEYNSANTSSLSRKDSLSRTDETSPSDKVNPCFPARLYDYLGRTLDEVVSLRGLPDKMNTLRGTGEKIDSVRFFYRDDLVLYWIDSHVWQLRSQGDASLEGSGLVMGMSREESEKAYGLPDLKKDNFSLYILPDKGFPVSCALYFDEGGLCDFYLYRSDL